MSPLEQIEAALAEIEKYDAFFYTRDAEVAALQAVPKLIAALRVVLSWELPEHPSHRDVTRMQAQLAKALTTSALQELQGQLKGEGEK